MDPAGRDGAGGAIPEMLSEYDAWAETNPCIHDLAARLESVLPRFRDWKCDVIFRKMSRARNDMIGHAGRLYALRVGIDVRSVDNAYLERLMSFLKERHYP